VSHTSLPRLSHAALPAPAAGVIAPTPEQLALPEKAVQFGTGAFLRGFVDAFIDTANAQGQFNGRVVAIGSTGSGRDRAFADQDGLYTLVARGVVAGRAQEEVRVVSAVSRALSAVDEWDAVLACARNPQLTHVFSNTTEVGIRLEEGDTADLTPPRSFPGKLTRFLYERARTFAFAPSKGVMVVPCELIEDNGRVLRDLVLQLADRWGYEPGFRRWVETAVPFVNTLVDRIVPGAPDDAEQRALDERLGYHDALLTTAEHFRLFVVEGDAAVRAQLGLADADPAVLVTPDIAPYRQRKVTLLNGAHTISASIALLAGCATVRDAMTHPQVGAFIRRVLLEEILPAVDAPDADAFAQAVLDRFENPHIRHALADITLHGTTKLRVRIIPTLIRAAQRQGRVPDALVLGFAAHLAYRRPERLAAREREGLTVKPDDAGARITALWDGVPTTVPALTRFVATVAADTTLWDVDLGAIPGFVDSVAQQLAVLESAGPAAALDALLSVSAP
jgi:tagaturonate reductase